ncbi:MAG: hypothetical protein M3P85_07375, partial [Actinomycetota bacterium]|nr:hypothetical protein [Actinomycetota bacterium]
SLKVPPEVAPADDFDTVIVAAQEAFHADARTTSPEADRWIEAKSAARGGAQSHSTSPQPIEDKPTTATKATAFVAKRLRLTPSTRTYAGSRRRPSTSAANRTRAHLARSAPHTRLSAGAHVISRA